MQRQHLKSSKNIWTISMLIFLAVAISMIFSTRYMNASVQREEAAEIRRAEYKQLGQDLADASDYLTEEVRYFAVTGDIEHLYNYWEEVFDKRTREVVIDTFEQSQPPKEEQESLEEAKKYSDALIETEINSMRLVLHSQGMTERDFAGNAKLRQYVAYVLANTEIEDYGTQRNNLSLENMKSQAVKMLYDEAYERGKEKIMNPIQTFQEQMNTRLNQEVELRRQETKNASMLQIILAVTSILALGMLLEVIKRLYIQPLEEYTTEIKKDRCIEPKGAAELMAFAEAFNEMIGKVHRELRHREEAEAEIKRAMEEAEFANETKSIFLAQMSHELGTPLNAINGYIYLLEQTSLVDKQRNYLQNIRYSSNGLLELINQILDFSKVEAGKLELECIPFSLQGLVKEVQGIFLSKAEEKGLMFDVWIDERIPVSLEGDPLRLRQVLVNLVSNAFKFTEEGSVSICVRLYENEQQETALEYGTQKCGIYFEIKDTGIGITEEAREKIFQPFTQSDASITRKYGGTGLGLPISSEIVALAGDKTHRLEVESTPGKGSAFFFVMDFDISAETIGKTAEDTEKIPDCGGKKVLLVDDREINRMVLSEILSLCHISVTAVGSGAEALRFAEKEKEIALVFMDIRMPEMDGYETSRRLKRIAGYERIPIIALTADAIPEIAERVKQAGMTDYLLKPLKQELLYEVLLKYLQHLTDENTGQTLYFDELACIGQLGGNKRALYEILQRFFLLHKADDIQMKQLIIQQQYKKAEEMAHQLKGIMGNLCCGRLYQCCEQLQMELQRENAKLFPAFCKEWKETLSRLHTVYQRYQQEFETAECTDNGVLRLVPVLSQMVELSENYDTEAVTLFEEAQTMLKSVLKPEWYDALAQAAYTYAFEDMSMHTRKILAYLKHVGEE